MDNKGTDEPVGYMERTRLYYRALGYKQDYVWANFDEVPFARLEKPLSQSRIALVTTSLPPDLADPASIGGKQLWSRDSDAAPTTFATEHVAWDKESTHTDDRESFLPIDRINEIQSEGIVGGLTGRIHGVPTKYSHRHTTKRDAPEIWKRIKEDGADAVMLAPL